MDDLEELEAATAAAEQLGDEVSVVPPLHGKVKRAGSFGGLSSTITPTKKVRRSGLLGLAMTTDLSPAPGSAVKREVKEEDDDDDDFDGCVGDGGESSASGDQEKVCPGCLRGSRTGKCFRDPTAATAWAFSQTRGQWCRYCYTCWRTCYSSSQPLSLFGQWLKLDANSQEWRRNFEAFWTLTSEGASRITSGMVVDRRKAIEFWARLRGHPLAHSVIVPLVDLSKQSDGTGPEVDPNMMVTIRGHTSDQIGMFVPWCPRPGHTLVHRPTSELCGSTMFDRMSLSTSSASGDEAFLSEKFGTGAGIRGQTMVGQVVPFSAAAAPTDDRRPDFRRLAAKFDVLKVAVGSLLGHFAEDTWENLKESQMTKHIVAFSALCTEASAIADQTMIDQSQTWNLGLSHIKKFLKAFHECKRSRHKHSKVLELGAPAEEARPFLVGTAKVTTSLSFELLWRKVMFFAHLAKPLSMREALGNILDGEFRAHLKTMSASAATQRSSGVSLDAWMRGIVLKALADMLCSDETNAKELAKVAQSMESDITAAVDAISSDNDIKTMCSDLLLDLQALLHLLRSTAEPPMVRALDVNAAIKHLQIARMLIVKTALESCSIGKAILSAATALVQVSARDNIADEKAERAVTMLTDARLPRLVEKVASNGELSLHVENYALVNDMSIVDVMRESMTNMAEAMRLWTPLRKEENADLILKWVTTATSNLLFYDECLSVHLQALVAGGTFGIELVVAAADEHVKTEEFDHGVADIGSNNGHAQVCGACKRLEEQAVVETPLEDLIRDFIEYLSTLPDDTKTCTELAESCDSLRQRAMNNIRVRRQLVRACGLLSCIPEIPATADAAVEEWRAKRGVRLEESSFLMCAARFLTHLADMENEDYNFGATGDVCKDDITLVLGGDTGAPVATELVGSLVAAQDVPRHLKAMTVVSQSRLMTRGALQSVVERLSEALHLPAIRCPRSPPPTDVETIPDYAVKFFASDASADLAKAAIKVFSPGSKHDWPAKALLDLAKELFQVVPSDSFEVSFHPMCSQPTTERMRCTDSRVVQHALEVYVRLSEVAQTWAFLSTRFCSCTAEAATRDYSLKAEVTSALSHLRTAAAEGLESCNEKLMVFLGSWKNIQWVVPITDCKDIFHLSRDVMPMLGKYFLMKSCEALVGLAHEVERHTPKTDHVLNDERFNANLAKKHLLSWPSRSVLTKQTVKLHGALRDLARLHSEWTLTPALASDPLFKDNIEVAQTLYDGGRRAITIIAALSVLFEMQGRQKVDQSKAMLDRKRGELPGSLIKQLELVAAEKSVHSAT